MYFRAVIRDIRLGLESEVRNCVRVSPENTRRIRASLGTALAAVCAVLLADALNLDNPWWAGITTVVVSRATYGATLAKGALRVIGTVGGAALSLPLVGLCIDNTFAMLSLIFFVATGTVIACLCRGRDSYAWSMAGFIIVLIALAALNMSPSVVFPFAVYRSMEISLGTVVAVVMSALFNREEPSLAVSSGLQQIWRDSGAALRTAARGWREGSPDKAKITELSERIRRQTAVLPGLIFESRVQGELKPEQAAEVSCPTRAAARFARRFFLILKEYPEPGREKQAYAALFADELEQAADALDQGAEAVSAASGSPYDGRLLRDVARSLRVSVDSMNARHQKLRSADQTREYSAEEMFAWAALRHLFEEFASALLSCAEENDSLEDKATQRPVHENMVIRQAVGLGLTMVLIPVIWNWFDFPGMMQIGVTSIVLLQPDPVVGRRKGILRLTGCLLGGATGLLLLGTPVAHYFGSWVLSYFILIFIFSFLERGDPRCSYIGLQAAIALTLTLVQGAGPSTTLEPPLTRLCGIAGAFFIWNIVHALQGGFDALGSLRRNMEELSGYLSRLLVRCDGDERKKITAEARLRLKEARQDLGVILWEGNRSEADNVLLQDFVEQVELILMQAVRVARKSQTSEAHELFAGPQCRLEETRRRLADAFTRVRSGDILPFSGIRHAVADAAADFEQDATRAREWARKNDPSPEALMEVGEMFMALRSLCTALSFITEREAALRAVFEGSSGVVEECAEESSTAA